MACLLILTNAYDATTDLLVQQLDCNAVVRLNFDQLGQYELRFDRNGLHIADPAGRCLTTQSITKAYWRKPFNGGSDGSSYEAAELRYILREIVSLLWVEEKFTLVEPFAEYRIGKLMQLRMASEFFRVPPYEVLLHGQPISTGEVVVKSLSSKLVGDKTLYTTRVRADALDLRFPWFIESYIPAVWDVTAVFVRGDVFSFALRRDFLEKTVDWREIVPSEQKWEAHPLPDSLREAICEYMKTLRLDFGRLDFLLDERGEYWFCEVNPNGQFAWLDLQREFGLLDSVVRVISPTTTHTPLSNHHALHAEVGCYTEK